MSNSVPVSACGELWASQEVFAVSEVLFLVFVKFWNYAFTWKPYQQIVVKD